MLIFLGILYTIGSYAFLRAVETPKVPPLFPNFYHFGSDELLGMWMFFLGTLPCIPCVAIYVYFYPAYTSYKGALFITILFCCIFFVAVYQCYPRREGESVDFHFVYAFCPCLLMECLHREQYLAPALLYCLPTCFAKHVSTDFVILSWVMFLGCIAGDVICVGLLWYGIKLMDGNEIYNWSTALLDMLLFTVGSMYFLAGAYPDLVVDTTGEKEENTPKVELQMHEGIVPALNAEKEETVPDTCPRSTRVAPKLEA